MNDTLLRLVYDRLDRDAAVDEPWAELVMAACEGEAAGEAVLDEQHAAAPLPAPAATASDPPGVFLRSISVAGFCARTLSLHSPQSSSVHSHPSRRHFQHASETKQSSWPALRPGILPRKAE